MCVKTVWLLGLVIGSDKSHFVWGKMKSQCSGGLACWWNISVQKCCSASGHLWSLLQVLCLLIFLLGVHFPPQWSGRCWHLRASSPSQGTELRSAVQTEEEYDASHGKGSWNSSALVKHSSILMRVRRRCIWNVKRTIHCTFFVRRVTEELILEM